MGNYIVCNNELYHHGVLGQRWGVRRYQNEDGSLTPEGEKRYSESLSKAYDDGNKTMTTHFQKELLFLDVPKATKIPILVMKNTRMDMITMIPKTIPSTNNSVKKSQSTPWRMMPH